MARHAAKVAELAAKFGGLEVLDPIERERVGLAATLLIRAQTPHSQEDEVRLINSADRLIARVEKSQRARKQRGPTFAQALAARAGGSK
jgi:hypothetical protein